MGEGAGKEMDFLGLAKNVVVTQTPGYPRVQVFQVGCINYVVTNAGKPKQNIRKTGESKS